MFLKIETFLKCSEFIKRDEYFVRPVNLPHAKVENVYIPEHWSTPRSSPDGPKSFNDGTPNNGYGFTPQDDYTIVGPRLHNVEQYYYLTPFKNSSDGFLARDYGFCYEQWIDYGTVLSNRVPKPIEPEPFCFFFFSFNNIKNANKNNGGRMFIIGIGPREENGVQKGLFWINGGLVYDNKPYPFNTNKIGYRMYWLPETKQARIGIVNEYGLEVKSDPIYVGLDVDAPNVWIHTLIDTWALPTGNYGYTNPPFIRILN